MSPQHDMIEVCWFHNLCLHYWSNAGKIGDSLLAYRFFLFMAHPWSEAKTNMYTQEPANDHCQVL